MIALGALLFRNANRTLVAVSMGPETVNQEGTVSVSFDGY